jgi:hypothetical protein
MSRDNPMMIGIVENEITLKIILLCVDQLLLLML